MVQAINYKREPMLALAGAWRPARAADVADSPELNPVVLGARMRGDHLPSVRRGVQCKRK